jgi:uncharacterized protein (TIGR01589 family)
MNQREVVAILQQQAKIEPDFTALVWQKLEEQNAEFFGAYYLRLRLKDQILAFNSLLEQHALLSQKLGAPDGGGGAFRGGAGVRSAGGAGGGSGGAGGNGGGGVGAQHGAPPSGGKISTSGLFLDKSGAFHAAGDYLIEHAGAGNGNGNGAGVGHGTGGGDGGGGHHHQHHGGGGGGLLGHLPRNFSLSDLSVELTAQMAEGDVHMALLSSALRFAFRCCCLCGGAVKRMGPAGTSGGDAGGAASHAVGACARMAAVAICFVRDPNACAFPLLLLPPPSFRSAQLPQRRRHGRPGRRAGRRRRWRRAWRRRRRSARQAAALLLAFRHDPL